MSNVAMYRCDNPGEVSSARPEIFSPAPCSPIELRDACAHARCVHIHHRAGAYLCAGCRAWHMVANDHRCSKAAPILAIPLP